MWYTYIRMCVAYVCPRKSGYSFYPRDAMLARLCDSDVSGRPSVRHTPVLCLAERKQDREMYTI